MNFLKHYQIQILLCTLACFKCFAYFYPGYSTGQLFMLMQVCLVITIIIIILTNRLEFKKHRYN